MKTILITGVAGFLGSHIARVFASQGMAVVGIDSAHEEGAPVSMLSGYLQCRLPDSRVRSFLSESRPDFCIHCAGRASVPFSIREPLADFVGNVAVFADFLAMLAAEVPKCRVIHLSSAAVYGQPQLLPVTETAELRPLSPYGFHKKMAEDLCSEYAGIYGLATANLRVFSAYGAGLRRQVLWDICSKLLSTGEIVLQGDGSESRDFIHAKDVARAALVVLERGAMRGESYNVASGLQTTIIELADELMESLKIHREIIWSGSLPEGTPSRWRADISRVCSIGFAPQISLQQGISDYVKWAGPLLGCFA